MTNYIDLVCAQRLCISAHISLQFTVCVSYFVTAFPTHLQCKIRVYLFPVHVGRTFLLTLPKLSTATPSPSLGSFKGDSGVVLVRSPTAGNCGAGHRLIQRQHAGIGPSCAPGSLGFLYERAYWFLILWGHVGRTANLPTR